MEWEWWQWVCYAAGWICLWAAIKHLRHNLNKYYTDQKEREDSG